MNNPEITKDSVTVRKFKIDLSLNGFSTILQVKKILDYQTQ